MSSKFEIYSFGYVASDFKEDSPYLSVTPIETLPTTNGDPNSKSGVKGSFTNIHGGIDNFTSVKSTTISAKWLPWNSSNGIAPCMHAGEMVLLLRYGGGDNFFWVSISNDIKSRAAEKVILMASAAPSRGTADNNYYYTLLDGINKCFRIHTSNANGEICGYDIDIDGATGTLVIQDTLNNEITLNSSSGILDIKTNNGLNTTTKDMAVKVNSLSITNDTGELIQILSDLVDALSNEVHIDSRGGNTRMNDSSKSALNGIKAKIQSFKK